MRTISPDPPTVEIQPGDIVYVKDGVLHARKPNRWDKFRWRVIDPILRVLFAPVTLFVLLYWAVIKRRQP